MRLLVVEDEPDLANAIARGLRRDGHAVDVALTASDADLKLRTAGYDLVCLDWSLPDGSGIALCRQLVNGELPTLEGERPRILMLTARDGVEDRVTGLDSGADDYLVKPFAFAELSARVRALLRLREELAERGAEARLVVPPGSRVERTLTLLQLERRFKIFGTVVLAWFDGAPPGAV